MDFSDDQVRELASTYGRIETAVEVGVTYFFIPALTLPLGCDPAFADALLCPTARDGYASRLFLSETIKCPQSQNWNASNVRILEKNWFAVSWRVPAGLSLIQMMGVHLRAFR